jgi:tripartite-type tricarboxylate transporter receptor subunit TctC
MGAMLARLIGVLAGAMLAASAVQPAAADDEAAFFHAHPVSVLIGYSPGGGYDAYARLLARIMPRYLPGNPTMVPQNMPGAGSLTLANYLYNIAPKDGSVFGIFGRGLAMAPLLGQPGTRFEASKFTWLGSLGKEVSLCVTGPASPVKSWADATQHDFAVGGEGSGSDPDVFATVLKTQLGAKLRLVSGYPGGNDILLAVERGELDGRCGWSLSSVKSTRPGWLTDKTFHFIIQLSLAASNDLPGVPLITDLAKTPEQQQIAKLIFSRQLIAWPFAAPPGLPPGRAEALRSAFERTLGDGEFLAEAKKLGLEVEPMSGAEVARLIAELYETPPEIVAAARAAITPTH